MKPKLMLRDLFWLVLVAAMGLGWWVDRQIPRPRERQLEATLDLMNRFLRIEGYQFECGTPVFRHPGLTSANPHGPPKEEPHDTR